MDYFSFHIGDFAKSTGHLTPMEDGVYNRLMRRYYDTEKPLPADVTYLQRIVVARSEEERQAVLAVLAEFFTLEEDGYHNKRCDEDIAAYRAKSEQNRINGSKGGKAKASACRSVSDGDAKANPSESDRLANACRPLSERLANQEPITNNQDRKSLTGFLTHTGEASQNYCELFAIQVPREDPLPLPRPPLPPQAEPKPARKAAKAAKATPLPDDFEPTENHKAYAVEHGLDLSHELNQFRAHHLAKGTQSCSWAMSLTTWLGNARKWSAERKANNHAKPGNAYGRSNRSPLPWNTEIQSGLDNTFQRLANADPNDEWLQQEILAGRA